MQKKWNLFMILVLLVVLIGGGIMLASNQFSSTNPGLSQILAIGSAVVVVLAVMSLANQFFK